MPTCGRWRRSPQIVELNIGHFIVGEAVAIGLPEAVRRMREMMDAGRRDLAGEEHSMKIAILGAGGVGGYFGARLAAHGNDVTFIARGAHAAAMRAGRAARAVGGRRPQVRPVRLHQDAIATGLVDIVLVAVKMYDLEAAAAVIKPLLAIDTAVVPFQNGVEAVGHARACARPALCLRRCRLYRRRHRGGRA